MAFLEFLKKLFRKRDYDYFIETAKQYYEKAKLSTDAKSKRTNIDLARNALANAIKINASRPEAYFVRAQIIMLAVENNDDLILAKQDLQTALRNDPSFESDIAPIMEQINMRISNSRAL